MRFDQMFSNVLLTNKIIWDSHNGDKKRPVAPYLIFVTGTTGGARGEKNCHVEKFVHITDCQVEKFSTWQIVMWKKISTWEM